MPLRSERHLKLPFWQSAAAISTRRPVEAAAKFGLARPQGARVTGITKASPAEMAKIQVGDVILTFGGMRIEDDNHLINLVSLTPVNEEVEVRLLRSGQRLTLSVRVANRTDMPAE